MKKRLKLKVQFIELVVDLVAQPLDVVLVWSANRGAYSRLDETRNLYVSSGFVLNIQSELFQLAGRLR